MAHLLVIFSSNYSCAWLDPGRANVVAPVTRFRTANELSEPSALLVSMDQFEDLFVRHVNSLFVMFLDKIVHLWPSFGSKISFLFSILLSFPHLPNS